jgi:hypothetical protein
MSADDIMDSILEELHDLKMQNSGQAALLEQANDQVQKLTAQISKIATLCDFIWERREQMKVGTPAFVLFKATMMEIYAVLELEDEENV